MNTTTNKSFFNKSDVETLLSMLNVNRLENPFWLDIGLALKNEFQDSFDIWIKFTQDKLGKLFFSNDKNKEIYDSLKGNLTFKTIAYYAKQDNPVKFEEWHNSLINDNLMKIDPMMHSEMGKINYLSYFLTFMCTSIRDETILEFVNGKWVKENHFISRCDLTGRVSKARSLLMNKPNDDYRESQIMKLTRCLSALKNKSFCHSIYRESLGYLYVDAQFDTNKNLIGVENGVLEILDNNVIFRPAKPEDYVSNSAAKFDQTLNEKSPSFQKLLEYLHQVFPNKDMFDYFRKVVGTCLKPEGNQIYLCIGSGSNSKSTLLNLIQLALGDYLKCYPSNNSKILTNNAFFPNGNAIDILNSKEFQVNNGLNIFLEINNMDQNYYNILERNCVHPILFESEWLPKVKDESTNKFQRNNSFSQNLNSLACEMLLFIVDSYESLQNKRLRKEDEPQVIQQWTHDSVTQFVSEKVEKIGPVSVSYAYNVYRNWYANNYDSKPEKREAFIAKIEKTFGPLKNQKWNNFRLIEESPLDSLN
jgi:hypothetical protein